MEICSGLVKIWTTAPAGEPPRGVLGLCGGYMIETVRQGRTPHPDMSATASSSLDISTNAL